MKNSLNLQNKSFEIFDNGGMYINQSRIYFAYFNSIPNLKKIGDIDVLKTKIWLEKELKDKIIKTHYCAECSKSETIYDDIFYILEDKFLINIYYGSIYVLFDEKHEIFAETIIKNALFYLKKSKRTKEISLVISSSHGLETKEIEIKKPNLSIDLHYNNDFKTVHQLVLRTLKQKKKKGLFLFHGLPGTGKSTYIKYLIHQQYKKVIFISPKMAESLDSTKFTEFLIENENSILVIVIEDAEELIVSRENKQNSHLSFLLNLTDGILADCLGIQIIATFNTDLKNIDTALLRKGRLSAIYEFKALEYPKVNQLLHHLEIEDKEIFQPMTLTDIFNIKEANFEIKKEKVRIGF
jgi:hypothetical protein